MTFDLIIRAELERRYHKIIKEYGTFDQHDQVNAWVEEAMLSMAEILVDKYDELWGISIPRS